MCSQHHIDPICLKGGEDSRLVSPSESNFVSNARLLEFYQKRLNWKKSLPFQETLKTLLSIGWKKAACEWNKIPMYELATLYEWKKWIQHKMQKSKKVLLRHFECRESISFIVSGVQRQINGRLCWSFFFHIFRSGFNFTMKECAVQEKLLAFISPNGQRELSELGLRVLRHEWWLVLCQNSFWRE